MQRDYINYLLCTNYHLFIVIIILLWLFHFLGPSFCPFLLQKLTIEYSQPFMNKINSGSTS